MKPVIPLLLVTAAASAQTQTLTRPAPTGTVIGHVLCADTQRPARLAQVKLVRVPSPTDEAPGKYSMARDSAPSGDPVETSLDGSYTLGNVKPGQYYVVVDKEGYLIPLAQFSAKELSATDDPTRARIAASVHTITVAADQSTREDVTLQRGASIAGTVHYDDGSPASGIGISLLVRGPEGKWVDAELSRYRSGFFFDHTDDDGNYRISGLPAGEYATQANLAVSDQTTQTGPMPNNPSSTIEIRYSITRFSLPLYSGDVFRKPQAVPYTLGTAEVRTGSDLTFPLAKLHKVTGQVVTKSGHTVNAGNVDLLYADDRSRMTEASIQFDDQLFHLDFIPEGEFLLEVKDPKDVRKVEVENAPGYTPAPTKKPRPSSPTATPSKPSRSRATFQTSSSPYRRPSPLPSKVLTRSS